MNDAMMLELNNAGVQASQNGESTVGANVAKEEGCRRRHRVGGQAVRAGVCHA